MVANTINEDENMEMKYQKGVKHLTESGIITSKVPRKYILPFPDRPNLSNRETDYVKSRKINLPIIDFAHLNGNNRSQVLKSLAKACQEYGIFQVVNHGIEMETIHNMIDVSKRFFELPFDERAKFMSSNMYSPVRYGTSFNQNKDGVFCWRDFLKLSCNSVNDAVPFWPSSPVDFRMATQKYSEEAKSLYMKLTEAILETLGIMEDTNTDEMIEKENSLKEFEDGSQLMVLNYYPACPEPELTLGMPPHSDYGLLTLLLQDEVKGLQIQHQGTWHTVDPIPNSFVVNVGDHLEIFSNGKYKSVLHRVLVNSSRSRISIASLHSLAVSRIVRPSPKLINEDNPRRYQDTDFATFLEYVSSCEPKGKNFLESRKLT
ncbi:hypothetical protein Leryth_016670 [Lithospermum erythrorhizon]|nr:hypothetical protein Leryth_016670 [Lithospermum erythrorhizon]